jgi:tetratricopeptide (TPR) repeat protein
MGQPAKAVEYFQKLATLMPGNATVYYNLACLYARQNRVEPAVESLKKALDAGYNDMDQIRTDRDIAPIRDTDFYKTRIDSQEPGK